MASAQVAVRLEPDIIEALDWLVVRCSFESRSEAVKAAIVEAIRREKERGIDQQYAEAYARTPLTPEEIDDVKRRSIACFDEEPWDKWW